MTGKWACLGLIFWKSRDADCPGNRNWVVLVTCMWGLFDSVLPCSNCFIFQIRSQRDSDPVPYLYLPDELVLLIFSFLPHKDLVSCSRVCWQFYRISMDESLCKRCFHSCFCLYTATKRIKISSLKSFRILQMLFLCTSLWNAQLIYTTVFN